MELTEARRLAVELAVPGGIELVSLENALGRVLAEQSIASRDLPEEPRSRLDGFALRSKDSGNATPRHPVTLKVLPGILAAGHPVTQSIGSGECIRILTGAPLPRGADAVVAQESCKHLGDSLVLDKMLLSGSGMTSRGEDTRRGDVLLDAGCLLTPTRLAVLAALGNNRIPVYRQPRVALLATGDEVREIDAPMEGPLTVCNNRLLLSWLVMLQGGVPIHLGVVSDDPGKLVEQLQGTSADVVITTGGIGRGERDFVLEAWKRLTVEEIFRNINLSPGKNSALGVRREQIFWALPGNPWGAQVVFEELVAPMLRRFNGLTSIRIPSMPAKLSASLKKKRGIYRAVRGTIHTGSEVLSFVPSGVRNESLFASLKNSFAYILLENHMVEMAAGTTVDVRLHDFPLLASPHWGIC